LDIADRIIYLVDGTLRSDEYKTGCAPAAAAAH